MKLKNEALQKLYDRLVDGPISLSVYAGVLEKPFEEVDRELTNLQYRNDILEKSNERLLSAYLDLCSKNRDLKNRIEQLEKELDKAKELKERFEKASSDRDELQKNLDYYMDIYKKVQDDYDELYKKYSECEAIVDKQAEQIRHLKTRLNSCCGIDYDKYIQKLQDDVHDIGYEQGRTDLWDALQNVNDTQPNEFDVECESMDDVISMDLEDFLDSYKKWQNQKETDRMRTWLADFCVGRVCKECPLGSHEYKCGCGYSFNRRDRFDLRIIPDEDIKRYYEKAIGCGQKKEAEEAKKQHVEHMRSYLNRYCMGRLCVNCPLYNASKPVTSCLFSKLTDGEVEKRYNKVKVIESVCKKTPVPVSARLPQPWECTIEGKFEINNDLLERVCGIKPDEEEHKLEYGDAVRVSWRNYDYMYIGPEEKHIRLFNPKNHTVVCVSPTDKLTYQGCKIIICDEDDLRKIWKDKK